MVERGGLADLARAEAQAARILPGGGIVHGVAAQQEAHLGARVPDGVGEPHRGVVLLLHGRAVRLLDDAQVTGHVIPSLSGWR